MKNPRNYPSRLNVGDRIKSPAPGNIARVSSMYTQDGYRTCYEVRFDGDGENIKNAFLFRNEIVLEQEEGEVE